jgi:hypothetical protein
MKACHLPGSVLLGLALVAAAQGQEPAGDPPPAVSPWSGHRKRAEPPQDLVPTLPTRLGLKPGRRRPRAARRIREAVSPPGSWPGTVVGR